MKKALLLILCLLAILCSCDQAPIFNDISQEIKLDDPSIKGKVYSIKKVDSILYAANSNLYTKTTSANRWSKISDVPSTIINLAYGKNDEGEGYLYVLANPKADTYTVYAHKLTKENVEEQEIYGKLDKESKWVLVSTGVSYLFDNQDSSAPNAYFTKKEDSSWKVYKLTGEGKTEQTDAKSIYGDVIKSAVRHEDTDYFSGNTSMVAYKEPAGTIFIYVVDEKTIKYANGINDVKDYLIDPSKGSPFKATSSTDKTIRSLSVYGNNIYAGTDSGFQIANIENSGTLSSFYNPENNAEAAFGTREVIGIWKFDDKDNFFVSVTSTQSSNYDALWGFNSSIKKWNIE